jgi:homeobox-leucine zipper protein
MQSCLIRKILQVEGGGCNNNANNYNIRELDINQPAFEEEEMEYPIGSIEDEIDEGREAQRPKKLRLSKEQSRLLEESFRQNHTLNPVCQFPSFLN